jgi:hypothetical protein
VKIAVFAPIPSASVNTATSVNTGFFRSIRNPNRKSPMLSSSPRHPHRGHFQYPPSEAQSLRRVAYTALREKSCLSQFMFLRQPSTRLVPSMTISIIVSIHGPD